MKKKIKKIFFIILLLLSIVLSFFLFRKLNTSSLVFGGDVFLARRMHYIIDENNYSWTFSEIKDIFHDSDLSLINLESVISSVGKPIDKHEKSPYYFRARPDLVKILTNIGVDIVNSANNHAGDYGKEALLQHMQILDDAGISHVGIGKSLKKARQYKIFKTNNVNIAIIGVDTHKQEFIASNEPGTNYIDENNPDEFLKIIKEQVDDAKNNADLVFLTVHWGPNGKDEPTYQRRLLAKRLIKEAGIDAILGHSAHLFQGVEIINNKPVIYDAGNLMLDYSGNDWYHKSLLFKLYFDKNGVKAIELFPIKLLKGRTIRADLETSEEIINRFIQSSKKLNPEFSINKKNNIIYINQNKSINLNYYSNKKQINNLTLTDVNDIKASCVISYIPKEIILLNKTFSNGVTLLGYKLNKTKIKKGYGFFLTTYWTTTKILNNSYQIYVKLEPKDNNGTVWRNSDTVRDHHPGDWSYPTYLWKSGEIIEDHFFIRAYKNSELGEHIIKYGLYTRDSLNKNIELEEIQIDSLKIID
jgi:poly-gamma-glutamate capsule biosynthesis protein CapA/YwtB (metallophosphatase superfamily)